VFYVMPKSQYLSILIVQYKSLNLRRLIIFCTDRFYTSCSYNTALNCIVDTLLVTNEHGEWIEEGDRHAVICFCPCWLGRGWVGQSLAGDENKCIVRGRVYTVPTHSSTCRNYPHTESHGWGMASPAYTLQ
jgi:hypothetical protein